MCLKIVFKTLSRFSQLSDERRPITLDLSPQRKGQSRHVPATPPRWSGSVRQTRPLDRNARGDSKRVTNNAKHRAPLREQWPPGETDSCPVVETRI